MIAVPPEWLTLLGMAGTWLAIAIGLGKYRMARRDALAREEQRNKDRDSELEQMAVRACREFTRDPEFQHARDQRIRELASVEIDAAFRMRASSFVATERFLADQQAVERRLASLETAIRENTKELGNIGGQITTAVTSQLTAYLSSTVFAVGARPL